MAPTIVIIRRAVCLSGVSSAKCAQLPSLCGVWQSTQFKPREAEKNPIVSINSSTGIPLRTWMLLKTSSAIRACCCVVAGGLADETPSRHVTATTNRVIVCVGPGFISFFQLEVQTQIHHEPAVSGRRCDAAETRGIDVND